MVVPWVVSYTESPTISPSVKTLLTSGLPERGALAVLGVQVDGGRVHGEGAEQHVVGLGDGAVHRMCSNVCPTSNSSK